MYILCTARCGAFFSFHSFQLPPEPLTFKKSDTINHVRSPPCEAFPTAPAQPRNHTSYTHVGRVHTRAHVARRGYRQRAFPFAHKAFTVACPPPPPLSLHIYSRYYKLHAQI